MSHERNTLPHGRTGTQAHRNYRLYCNSLRIFELIEHKSAALMTAPQDHYHNDIDTQISRTVIKLCQALEAT